MGGGGADDGGHAEHRGLHPFDLAFRVGEDRGEEDREVDIGLGHLGAEGLEIPDGGDQADIGMRRVEMAEFGEVADDADFHLAGALGQNLGQGGFEHLGELGLVGLGARSVVDHQLVAGRAGCCRAHCRQMRQAQCVGVQEHLPAAHDARHGFLQGGGRGDAVFAHRHGVAEERHAAGDGGMLARGDLARIGRKRRGKERGIEDEVVAIVEGGQPLLGGIGDQVDDRQEGRDAHDDDRVILVQPLAQAVDVEALQVEVSGEARGAQLVDLLVGAVELALVEIVIGEDRDAADGCAALRGLVGWGVERKGARQQVLQVRDQHGVDELAEIVPEIVEDRGPQYPAAAAQGHIAEQRVGQVVTDIERLGQPLLCHEAFGQRDGVGTYVEIRRHGAAKLDFGPDAVLRIDKVGQIEAGARMAG